MEFLHFIAQKNDENRRFDRLIMQFLPLMPRSIVQKNIRTGFIRLNKKKASHNTIIQEKDSISIASFLYKEYAPEQKIKLKIPENYPIQTIFKNEHLWIVHKDAGLLSQKANKNDLSINCILKAQNEKNSKDAPSLSFSPSILHRLDRETSGLLVFSQSLAGAQWFSKLIQENSLGKTYFGIAQGKFENKEQWEDKINNELCITQVKALENGSYNGKPISLIAYTIITGKKHQIRKQSALHGFHLLGDKKYQGYSDKDIESFSLHAYELRFPENKLGIPQEVHAAIPENFVKIAKLCLLKLDSLTIIEKVYESKTRI